MSSSMALQLRPKYRPILNPTFFVHLFSSSSSSSSNSESNETQSQSESTPPSPPSSQSQSSFSSHSSDFKESLKQHPPSSSRPPITLEQITNGLKKAAEFRRRSAADPSPPSSSQHISSKESYKRNVIGKPNESLLFKDMHERLRAWRERERKEEEGGSSSELGESNERLIKLREIEEKETASNKFGGLTWKDLRERLVSLKMSDDEKAMKSSIQGHDTLCQLCGASNSMLSKEHLVEKMMASRQLPLISFDDARESQAHWTKEQEDALIDIMVEQVNVGNRRTNAFGGAIWKKIQVEFYMATGMKYKIKKFQDEYDLLRKCYRTVTDLLPTGFGWDPALNTATAPNDVWEKYIKAHPIAKKFRTETCRTYDQLVTIFGDTTATSKEARASIKYISDSDDEYEYDKTETIFGFGDIPDSGARIQYISNSDDDTRDIQSTTFLPTDDSVDIQEDLTQQRNRSRDDTSSGTCRVRSHQSRASELSESIKLPVEASHTRTTVLQNSVGANPSVVVGSYSIPKCIEVLDSIDGLVAPTYLKAIEKFHDIKWRVTFISMPSERRLAWLASLV